MGSGLNQVLLGELKALRDTLSGLGQRSLRGWEILVAGPAADRRGLPRGSLHLGQFPAVNRVTPHNSKIGLARACRNP
jgi:hypothetical protein